MDGKQCGQGTTQADLLSELLSWSAKQPLWQRDALRRLVEQGALTDTDVDQLLAICLKPHGLKKGDDVSSRAEPLDTRHLPAATSSAGAVTLVHITSVENVNALAQNQTLEFAPSGITVIYGGNGSGKSGYARILRHACKARAPISEIQPNLFAGQASSEQSASIAYRIGGKDTTMQWRPSVSEFPDLSRVSVFDADCARVQVNDKNEVAFRPFGLAVLDGLARCCDVLRDRLQGLLDELTAKRPTFLSAPPVGVETAVGHLLNSLSGATKSEEVEALSGLDEAQKERLTEANATLANDPREAARNTRATRGLIAQVRDVVAKLVEQVDDAAVGRFLEARRNASELRTLAQTLADSGFDDCPLAGVGGESWRALWEAARRYSGAEAYPDREFPIVAPGAYCVLCQQPLDEGAGRRLERFEAFVKEDVQERATEAEATYKALKATVAACQSDLPAAASARLSESDENLGTTVQEFLTAAVTRRDYLLAEQDEDATGEAPLLGDSPLPRLDSFLEHLDAKARRLDEAASDEAREKLKQEAAELDARQWLATVKAEVLAEITRLGKKGRLETCMPDVDTTKVTKAVTALSKRFLNDALREAFSKELDALKLRTFSAVLNPTGGAKGTSRYQVQMEQAPGVSVEKVASEGEYRVLALAGFLSELTLSSELSAIVLDDPVCSLDHIRRQHVAERLVQESRLRQVIVLTHDIVFLAALVEHARRQRLECSTVCLESNSKGEYGLCAGTLPWDSLKVNDRIKRLNVLIGEAEKRFKLGETEAYGTEAVRIRRLIRQTWERAVEEVLLGGVVERFKPHVHTQQLSKLTDIVEDDLQVLDAAMSRCSEPLHDQPAEAIPPCHDPEELAKEVKLLKDWVKAINKRRE